MSVAARFRYPICCSCRHQSQQLSTRLFSSFHSAATSPQREDLLNRRYSLDGHYWLNIKKSDVEDSHIVEIGIAQNLLDTKILGSVDTVTIPHRNSLPKEPSSLALHWSGLKVGSGDELYHAIWENVEDTFYVEPFLPVKVDSFSAVDFNTEYMQNPSRLDDTFWLLRINFSSRDEVKFLSKFLSNCRTQEEHDSFCLTNTYSKFETELS
jgi:hypothetical protein